MKTHMKKRTVHPFSKGSLIQQLIQKQSEEAALTIEMVNRYREEMTSSDQYIGRANRMRPTKQYHKLEADKTEE